LIHSIGGDHEQRRQLIAETMAEVGQGPMSMDRYTHEFSVGQRQRPR
jgi:ABC-type microcin C transport system duplicated ATPase subunit YejF